MVKNVIGLVLGRMAIYMLSFNAVSGASHGRDDGLERLINARAAHYPSFRDYATLKPSCKSQPTFHPLFPACIQ